MYILHGICSENLCLLNVCQVVNSIESIRFKIEFLFWMEKIELKNCHQLAILNISKLICIYVLWLVQKYIVYNLGQIGKQSGMYFLNMNSFPCCWLNRENYKIKIASSQPFWIYASWCFAK